MPDEIRVAIQRSKQQYKFATKVGRDIYISTRDNKSEIMKKKESIKKTVKIVLTFVAVAGVAAAIAFVIGVNIGKRQAQGPKIAELKDTIRGLEVELKRLQAENSWLAKRLESVIYHLGKVVAKYENKSYQN